MTTILIMVLLFVGGFGGGMITQGVITSSQPPKTVIQNSYQDTKVTSRSESIQQNLQVQSTVYSPNTNLTISIRDYTNLIKLTNIVISNFSSKTNK